MTNELMDRNTQEGRFTTDRTNRCVELMQPDVRTLVDLPLDAKIKKSQDVIKDALKRYPKMGLGFSGGTDSLVLMHLVLPFKRDIPVVFVDTQHEFPETYKYIDQVVKNWGIKDFTTVKADQDRLEEFKGKYGLKTPEFTTTCCNYHKISPMMKAIGDFKFDAFFVGLRGVEHEERAKEVFFSPRKDPVHIRVHPLLFWRKEDILEYVKKFDLECNPLYKEGYTSLGCTVCTEKNLDPGMHERAGRGVVRETVMKRLRDLGYT
jgi:phosphoadenosine phosphosulfate reductase